MTTHNADPRWEELERLRREVAELRDVEERLQQEIAERQRLETAVAAGETRIRRMFENAPVGIALVDLDERIIEVNQALCDILGYDKETLLTKTVPEITHPDDIAVEAKYKADSKEGQFDNFMLEKRYIHADGRIIWGRLSVSTITDDGGSPLYFIGQMEDITRRKKAEEALLTSETRFRMLVEQSPFSIIIYDRNGRILMANLASKQLWRLSPEHFDNLAANYSILEDEVLAQSGLLQQIKQAFAGKAATIPPTVMTLQDYPYEEAATQKLWIAAYAYPVKDEMGHVQEVVVMHEDVTERVLAEEALRQSQEQFELFFTQSIDGCFFMMLDEPLRWDGNTDKESALDYAFGHQRISKINQAMLDQYGAEAAAFIGLTPADFYAHDIPYGRKSWCELFDNGRIRLETNERKQDGTPMWVEGEYVCLYDEDGRIIGHFGIQRDITTRRQMEQALWESEGHFRSLMESAQEFVLYRLRIEPLSPQQA